MSRLKKSRSMKGKLSKTGTKEMLKEQKKARKAASPSRFDAKKAKQRKEQSERKLERLGIATEAESGAPKARPKRFVFTPNVAEQPKNEAPESVSTIKDDLVLSENELLDAFTEQN